MLFRQAPGGAGRWRRSSGSWRRATARRELCRRRRGGMGCLRANCSPGAGWPEQGGLLRPKRLPHSRQRLSAGRLRRPVRHRFPNALKVRRTYHTHLVLSVLRAGSRSFPYILATQVVPKVALAPILIAWFGIGMESRLILAFLISYFPMVINT